MKKSYEQKVESELRRMAAQGDARAQEELDAREESS